MALAPLAASVITFLTTFGIVHWSGSQTTLVSTEVGAIIGLLSAAVAHFWPGTKKEPVALAATFTAAVSATIALGTGFAWWHLTAKQATVLVTLVTALIGVGSAWFARSKVNAIMTPQ
ncbi:MAG: hypothetical protein M3071_14690 [Actinomycetota bacterium]|nr:hypothetical protein [Actinomycetota bacterium]